MAQQRIIDILSKEKSLLHYACRHFAKPSLYVSSPQYIAIISARLARNPYIAITAIVGHIQVERMHLRIGFQSFLSYIAGYIEFLKSIQNYFRQRNKHSLVN